MSEPGRTKSATLFQTRPRLPLAKATALSGAVVLGASLSPAAVAYVGPGAGLGALGILLAILAAILMALVGLVLWPVRMIAHRRKLKARAAAEPDGVTEMATEDDNPEENAPASARKDTGKS